ncbi:MAG: transcription repressor NadR [Chloroflexota bacterium]
MNTEQRRARILKTLDMATKPITGTDLASQLNVSRQVIVTDIAVLRAGGMDILASPQGYYRHTPNYQPHRAVVAVRHAPEQTEDELVSLVDIGVEVVDVIIEHPIYGEQRGMLHISSREDVRLFIDRLNLTGAKLLSELTEGLHLHTLESSRADRLDQARNILRQRGYLVE